MNRVRNIIERHRLVEHPEGGWYREIYRSPINVSTPYGARSAATTILFLIDSTTFSAFHKLRQEEIWQFCEGDPLEIHTLSLDGFHEQAEVGPENRLYVVGPNFQQAARTKGAFTLCTCTVVPGFDFDDFEMQKREELLANYPKYGELIMRFTR